MMTAREFSEIDVVREALETAALRAAVALAGQEDDDLAAAPQPPPAVDGLMAATAQVHGLTLVTRNVADVARTGVRVVNPFG